MYVAYINNSSFRMFPPVKQLLRKFTKPFLTLVVFLNLVKLVFCPFEYVNVYNKQQKGYAM